MRQVEPELLDQLPHDHPDGLRSRCALTGPAASGRRRSSAFGASWLGALRLAVSIASLIWAISLAACRERDLVVGRDLSLIGFDDSPWAEVFTPAVSVVKRPIYDLGEAAVTSLVRRIGGGSPGGSVELSATLIDRQSVRDLKAT